MNNSLQELQKLYEDYIVLAYAVQVQSPYGASFMSSQKDPRLDPCHSAFYEAVGAILTRFVEKPDGDPEPLLHWMLQAPEVNKEQIAYWYLVAALNHAKLLIPLLSSQQRKNICNWYSQMIPKRQRYPIQEKILRLLK